MNDLNDERFDLIVAANVFHHISPDKRVGALSDCRKVLSDKGKMFIFEHNPYNPATRWVFERCPFDVDAEMLSKGSASRIAKQANLKITDSGYTLFFPAQLSFLRGLEKSLKMLPLGAQYYVQLEK
jgi:cyclopropane fatty-acyl-phospholipid synthase-like methyltransferase